MRSQTPQEEVESSFLCELARCALAEPRLMAKGRSWAGIGEEHFSDSVYRDVFRQIAPVIRSEKMTTEVRYALEMLAAVPMARTRPLLNELRDCLISSGSIERTELRSMLQLFNSGGQSS